LKRALKGPVLDSIQGIRRRLYRPPPELAGLEAEHKRVAATLPADTFEFRPGLRARVDDRARVGFEWFCFRSLDMVREYDLFQSVARDKRNFLDVGACHGVFSLAFTMNRPGCRSVAVDPSPMAFEVLSRNVALNPELDIRTVNVAAGDAPGEIVMRKEWHHLEAIPAASAGPEDLRVPVMTVDAILAREAYEPDLIKFDVEGYEWQAVKGARGYLGRNPVDLFIEIHPDRIAELGYTVKDLTDELERLGYHFYTADTQRRRTPAAEVIDRLHVNWVFCSAK
jgi:FkbM family methyltransferase